MVAQATLGVLRSEAYTGTDHLEYESTALDVSPAAVMAALIIDGLELASSPADGEEWPLFIGFMPQNQSSALAIYNTPGTIDGRSSDNTVVQHYGIQVRVNDRDYETGYSKLSGVLSSMDQIKSANVERDSVNYNVVSITRTSAIIPLGLDEKRIFSFTSNVIVAIKQEI